jgi:hypothetical protein
MHFLKQKIIISTIYAKPTLYLFSNKKNILSSMFHKYGPTQLINDYREVNIKNITEINNTLTHLEHNRTQIIEATKNRIITLSIE